MNIINQLYTSVEKKKFLEENIGSTLFDLSEFFYMFPQAREAKAKMNKWKHIKLKIVCTSEETINLMKMPCTE